MNPSLTGQTAPMPLSHPLSRAWLEIDLGALLRNARALRNHAGVPLLPMVKADAYGLGAEPVVNALEKVEPWGYGVATVEEGTALRSAGISRRILIFNPLLAEEFEAAHTAGLVPTLGSEQAISEWKRRGGPWHLSIDTGMSRAGVPWRDTGSLARAVLDFPPEGAFTHFHSPQLNDASMAEQEGRFREALERLPFRPGVLHAEGSAAIERHAGSEWTLVRPGIFLYGVGSGEGSLIEPEQVVHMRARVVELRWLEAGDTVSYDATYTAPSPRLIATIPMGYADGYPRSLSSVGQGLLRGRRVPVAGRVTMDMIMLDVTEAGCEIGDVVTLLGTVAADEDALSVEEVAARAEISPYELLTRLRGRLTRVYRNS